jgi:hypothetical protein
MKAGISLVELAQKIEDAKSQKKDFVIDTRALRYDSQEDKLAMEGQDAAKVTEVCHTQIGERIGIPAKYYSKMRNEAPELLERNINHWFEKKPERRMVRILGDNARAFLSDRYQRVDNEEVAEMVLPVLTQYPGLQIASCELTERRMYIKATVPQLRGEVKVGDVVEAGIMISNSEIGLGAVSIFPFMHRLICTNGMVMNDSSLRAHHVGGRVGNNESIVHMLTDETLRADDKAILLKVRDVCKATLSQEVFDRHLNKMKEADGQKIEGNPVKAVEVLSKRFGFSEYEQGSILRHLVEGGSLTKWGLANAVTRHAHEPSDYDRATELEQVGGKIVDLPATEWRTLAMAA